MKTSKNVKITAETMLEALKAAGSKGIYVKTRDADQRVAFAELKAKGLVKASHSINALHVKLIPALTSFPKRRK